MGKILPSCTGDCRGPDGHDAEPPHAVRLLLVSGSRDWKVAAQAAAAAIGGVGIACNARCAVARLAGLTSGYSHLLVDRDDDLGLFDAMADLVAESTSAETDILVLGAPRASRPAVRAVPAADPGSVRAALLAPRAHRPRPAIPLAELRATLCSAMLETRYQPIVALADGAPVAVEALVRLKHPGHGTLMPDSFVPQLEAAGLGAELTRLVSASALADMTRPPLAGRGLRMAVNFPLDVLLQPEALEELEALRLAFGLAAGDIVVELTESQPPQDFPLLCRSLEALRALGYEASIDDAGPAVPDLERLMGLPFTGVKLDKSLVRGADASMTAHDALASLVGRAKAAGLSVVAEGVETPALWRRMRGLGADFAQGFLIARPLPLAAVPIWCDAWDRFPRPG